MASTAQSATERPSSRFWDRIAPKYAKEPPSDPAALEHKLNMIRDRLRPSMEVLEVGSGTGTTALKLAPLTQRYAACDISPKMIEIAQEKQKKQPTPNLSFAVKSVEELEDTGAKFDAILGMSLLHLLKDRRRAIEKLYHLTKPGGYFFSNTACLKDMRTILKLFIPIGRVLGLAPMVKSFSATTLRAELQKAGFEIESEWSSGASTSSLFIVARRPG
ncbi:MAG: class I SAM-dependent methyltransferase [Neomegalonema sp.]|nr:class I SAM-dependent methyltransferase [Neomegalonema sp.]